MAFGNGTLQAGRRDRGSRDNLRSTRMGGVSSNINGRANELENCIEDKILIVGVALLNPIGWPTLLAHKRSRVHGLRFRSRT